LGGAARVRTCACASLGRSPPTGGPWAREMSTCEKNEKNVEELKSLVVHTLETNGVLGQIRAQLRANVYKAIDNDEEQQGHQVITGSAKKLMKTSEGKLMAEIVAEFFEFYEFRHSLSVFVPESNLGKHRRSRAEIALEAGLERPSANASILEQLVGLASAPDLHKGAMSSASSTTASSPLPEPSSVATVRPSPAESVAGSPSASVTSVRGKSDCDTPPHRDHARPASGAAATAVASAISAGIGDHKSSGSTAPGKEKDAAALGSEATNDDAADASEEVAEEIRRPAGSMLQKPRGGKLPSLPGSGGLSSLTSSPNGKEPLPSTLSPGAKVQMSPNSSIGFGEEVSLADSSACVGLSRDSIEDDVQKDMERLKHIDKEVLRAAQVSARIQSAHSGGDPARDTVDPVHASGTVGSVSGGISMTESEAMVEEVGSDRSLSGGNVQSPSRSASGSHSLLPESPVSSPAASHSSPLASPAASSGSRPVKPATGLAVNTSGHSRSLLSGGSIMRPSDDEDCHSINESIEGDSEDEIHLTPKGTNSRLADSDEDLSDGSNQDISGYNSPVHSADEGF